MRKDLVDTAVKFLSAPQAQGKPRESLVSFLEKNKSLTKEEIDEAFRLVAANPTSSLLLPQSPPQPQGYPQQQQQQLPPASSNSQNMNPYYPHHLPPAPPIPPRPAPVASSSSMPPSFRSLLLLIVVLGTSFYGLLSYLKVLFFFLTHSLCPLLLTLAISPCSPCSSPSLIH